MDRRYIELLRKAFIAARYKKPTGNKTAELMKRHKEWKHMKGVNNL